MTRLVDLQGVLVARVLLCQRGLQLLDVQLGLLQLLLVGRDLRSASLLPKSRGSGTSRGSALLVLGQAELQCALDCSESYSYGLSRAQESARSCRLLWKADGL